MPLRRDAIPVAKDLTAVIALQGLPCGEVVSVTQKGENDYVATLQGRQPVQGERRRIRSGRRREAITARGGSIGYSLLADSLELRLKPNQLLVGEAIQIDHAVTCTASRLQ